jgi:hypothetical protein
MRIYTKVPLYQVRPCTVRCARLLKFKVHINIIRSRVLALIGNPLYLAHATSYTPAIYEVLGMDHCNECVLLV